MTTGLTQLRRCAHQMGAAMVEFVIAAPVLLMLGLGALQAGLMVHAHNIVTYATFEAAREGATHHAQPDAMRRALGLRIAPLFGGDGSTEKAGEALLLGLAEALDPRYTDLQILNPTPAAFTDFAVPAADGFDEIPNHNLKYRPRDVGPTSDVNIQDANLLKVRVTYAYPLKIPLVNKVVLAALRRLDPDNARFYLLGRLPVTALATVHMQSPARRPGEAPTTAETDGAQAPSPPGQPPAAPAPDTLLPDGGGGVDDASGCAAQDAAAAPAENGPGIGCGEDTDQLVDGETQACGVGDDSGNPLDDRLDSPGQSSPVPGTGNPLDAFPSQPGVTPGPGGAITDNPSDSPLQTVGNPINVISGNKYQREVDLAAGAGGLAFIRHYNSRQSGRAGVVGHGWRHNFEARLSAGRDLIQALEQAHSGNSAWPSAITLVQADGRAIRFELESASVAATTESAAESAAEPVPVRYRSGGDGTLQFTGGAHPFLWSHDRTRQRFDRSGRLVRLEAPGIKLRLTYTQGQLRTVTDQQGRQLGLDYHANGRLRSLIDPAGHITRYGYDDHGNLTQVARLQGTTGYGYEDPRHKHALTHRTDPAGRPAAHYAYDATGRAILSERAGGLERVALQYQPGLTLVTDARGQVSHYHHSRVAGRPVITRVQGPGCRPCGQNDGDSGSEVSFTYNDRAQLLDTHYSSGQSFTRAYDAKGRLLSLTETGPDLPSGGHTTRFAYDGDSSRPLRITRPSVQAGAELAFEYLYDAEGKLLELVGTGFEPTIDAQGAVRYRPITRRTSYSYDVDGRLEEASGPAPGAVTRYRYNASGQLISSADASGQTLRYLAYDGYGRPTQIESQGLVTSFTYEPTPPGAGADHHGRAPGGGGLRELSRSGRKLAYSYDASGRLLSLTDPSSRTTTFTYDNAGRLLNTLFPDGAKRERRLDSAGAITRIAEVGPHGDLARLQRFDYRADGKLTEYEDPHGAVALHYLEQGLAIGFSPISEAPPAAPLALTVTPQLRYNTRGQLLERAGVSYGYDLNGRLAEVTMPRSAPAAAADGVVTTRYLHNDFGELSLMLSPDSGTTHYSRDSGGRVTAVTVQTADGQFEPTRSYRYDLSGRLLSETAGDTTTQYDYDSHGRLTRVAGPDQTTEFTYTPLGEVATHTRVISGQSFVSHFEYDRVGRLFQQRTPAGPTLRYHYHSDGPNAGSLARIEQVGWLRDQTLVEALNQDDSDRLSSRTYGNGLTETWRRNANGEIEGMALTRTLNLDYRYSAAGDVTTFTQVTPSRYIEQRYGYADGRLQSVARQGSGAGHAQPAYEGYVYDAAGNRRSRTRVPAATDSAAQRLAKTGSTDRVLDFDFTVYDYADGSNRLVRVQGDAAGDLRYDPADNPTQVPLAAGLLTYTYNRQGRPIAAHRGDHLIAEYAYNSLGERISKTVHPSAPSAAPVTTHYLYEDQRLLAEADAKGRITTQYHYQNGRPIGLWRDGAYYHLHNDRLGAPQAVTDAEGTLVWRADATPWGEISEDQDPDGDGQSFALALRLPGQIYDRETGTHYNYRRDYSPEYGRYLAADPLGQAGGLNVYAYAAGNPLAFVDPLGLQPMSAPTAGPSQLVRHPMTGLDATNSNSMYYRVASFMGCDQSELDELHDAIELLSTSGDRSHFATLYNNALDRLLQPIGTGFLSSDQRSIATLTPNPDPGQRTSDPAVLTNSEIEQTQSLVRQLTSSPPDDAVMVLVDHVPLAATLQTQLTPLFGPLVTYEDAAAIRDALSSAATPANLEGAAYAVDLAPLRDEINQRSLAQLFGDTRVYTAWQAWLKAVDDLHVVNTSGNADCGLLTMDTGSDECLRIQTANNREHQAESTYEDTLEQVAAELRAAGQPITVPTISGRLPGETEPRLASARQASLLDAGYPHIAALYDQALFIADNIAVSGANLSHDDINNLLADPDLRARVNERPDLLYSWANLEPGFRTYQATNGNDATRASYRNSIAATTLDYDLQRYSQLFGLEAMSGIPPETASDSDILDYVQRFLSGFWDGIKGQLHGLWEMLTNPLDTVKALYKLIAGLITEPEKTINAIWAEMSEFSDAILHGDGYTLGKTVGEFVGPAAVKKIVDGLKNAGKLAQMARRIEDGCSSFTAGTLVWTEYGLRAIETIKSGEKVWSRNDKTYQDSLRQVTDVFSRKAESYFALVIGSEMIEGTAEHPFWLQGAGWTETKDLEDFQIVAAAKGDVPVHGKAFREESAVVFNLSVDKDHSYFVSRHKIWVHNAKCYPKEEVDLFTEEWEPILNDLTDAQRDNLASVVSAKPALLTVLKEKSSAITSLWASMERTATNALSLVLDSNAVTAINRRHLGLPLNANHEALLRTLDGLGALDIRLADMVLLESITTFNRIETGYGGLLLTASRLSEPYQQLIRRMENLTDANGQPAPLGGVKGIEDRQILADLFFSEGPYARFISGDGRIVKGLARLAGIEPSTLGKKLSEAYPDGFDVVIQGKTVKVLTLGANI